MNKNSRRRFKEWHKEQRKQGFKPSVFKARKKHYPKIGQVRPSEEDEKD